MELLVDQNEISVPSPDKRLPIAYEHKGVVIRNAFMDRAGKFTDPNDEFLDICYNNLTWAVFHIFKWKGKPLQLAPFQSVILQALWDKTFPLLVASRGGGKTFLLGLYAALHALLVPGSKVVIVSNSFRQSRLVFEVIEELYNQSPIFAAACNGPPLKPNDSRELRIGDSFIKAVPLGNGEKIRGLRATVIISDETASVPPEIFQIVVRGFAAVSADPIEMAKKLHEEDLLVKSGALRADQRTRFKGNKIIYAGTANFQFNHFYKIYSVHKAIIEKKLIGAASELYKEYAMEGDGDEEIDFRDYAIIQLPYFAIPKGFMDERQISQGKATMPRALFEMEYCCVFPTDSDGFFRRSAINDSTPGFNKIGKAFGVEFKGDPAYEYVMGIDPARKSDNFAISILKLMGDGTYKNVYCCSLNRKSYVDAVAKIRELLKKFNIVRIAMDAGGGGTAVEDLLQTGCGPGELPIWRWNEDEHRPYAGLHILEIVNFVPSWIRDANHGLASDIEHKKLLFPYRTPEQDIGDQEEEVHAEIDEQINEMVNIVITRTKSGVEHFDMPDMSQNSTLNVIQRKDRYSALLLSTYAARSLLSEEKKEIVPFAGGWLDSL